MGRSKRLNNQWRMFALQYALDHNGARAAIAAGYHSKRPEHQAWNLLQNPVVLAEIQRYEAEFVARLEATKENALKELEITAEQVLQGIAETIERCKQSYPVLDKNGDPVMVETPDGTKAPAYKFDPANVLKGCELLGRYFKLFVDRVEQSTTDERVKSMSDAELARKLLGGDEADRTNADDQGGIHE